MNEFEEAVKENVLVWKSRLGLADPISKRRALSLADRLGCRRGALAACLEVTLSPQGARVVAQCVYGSEVLPPEAPVAWRATLELCEEKRGGARRSVVGVVLAAARGKSPEGNWDD